MKIKEGFVLGDVAESYVVIPVGDEAADFRGIITLNDTGAFLWERMQKECTKEELVKELLLEYEVSEEGALRGVEKFLDYLREYQFLEE